jgi:hypothetical protein
MRFTMRRGRDFFRERCGVLQCKIKFCKRCVVLQRKKNQRGCAE